MKKIILPLLLMIVFVSCKTPQAVIGMSEAQFKKEHRYADQVEASAYRTVYKEPYSASYMFYYFKDGKMYLLNQGYVPFGTKEPLPSR